MVNNVHLWQILWIHWNWVLVLVLAGGSGGLIRISRD